MAVAIAIDANVDDVSAFAAQCIATDNVPNVISGSLRCEADARVGGGNGINGRLSIGTNVTFAGRSNVAKTAIVTIGANSTVGAENYFANTVKIGVDNHIGSQTVLQILTSAANVTIGSNGFIMGKIGKGSRIGSRCTLLKSVVVGNFTSIGDNVVAGNGVQIIQGGNVGSNSCIGDGVVVDKLLPSNWLWNKGEAPRPVLPGATWRRVRDRCVEIVAAPAASVAAPVVAAVSAAIPLPPARA